MCGSGLDFFADFKYNFLKGVKGMKIIFLDIDGVLNSAKYDKQRKSTDGNIDPTRLPLLKRIIEATNAKIVLTSTWRKFWEMNEESANQTGKELNRIFKSAGLEIFDKTPVLGSRKEEISAWIFKNKGQINSFCIIDDIAFGWEELGNFVVNTNPLIGYGLEENHVKKAIEILNSKKD